MDWIERFNQSISYIEEHLTDEIEYEQASKIACCSVYHFQRMFTYLAGISLSEYIRRRRMSLAAVELRSSDQKVITIALKYGYSSPTAFNRAFQNVHGIAPSAVKKEGKNMIAYPPISLAITVKGVEALRFRVEEKNAFRIVGISRPLESEIEKNFISVPQMWQKMSVDGTILKIAEKMDSQPMGLLGVSCCDNEEEWSYYIAAASSHPAEEGFEEYLVPAATWAIFSGNGTKLCMQELERRIVTEWLPGSGYEYANAPDIEVYLNADPENMQYEIWIPVIKK